MNSEAKGKDARLSVRISSELLKEFRQASEEIGVPQSQLVLMLIRGFLARHAKRDKSQRHLSL